LSQFCYVDAFTVMSYNIEVYDKDGEGWDGRNPAKATETVLSVLPDVIGFQEVNQKTSDGWDSYLASLATEGGYTRLTGSYTGKYDFEKNEIFFKTDKFTKISEGTKTFKKAATELNVPNTENADQSLDKHGRIFHYVVLEQIATGKKILVVNTHLHYGGTGSGHEEDDKVRRYEISALLAWLQLQVEEYPDQIVLGDMNANYKADNPNNGGTRTMATFLNGGFAMTSLSAKVKDDAGGTLAVSDRNARAEYVFDHVLTKGALGAGYYTVVDNPNDVGNSYPSDHIPVMAEIYFLQ
jgi:endonuclease/exonuclease/phosphatase family metal-dependent hydrolase